MDAGVSQGAVAKKLGYTSPQFISNWERGLSRPPISTLRKIAQIYGIHMDEMFEIVLQTSILELTTELTDKFYKKEKQK